MKRPSVAYSEERNRASDCQNANISSFAGYCVLQTPLYFQTLF